MKLLYPTSLKLDVQSLEGFSVELYPYDVAKPFPDEHVDAEILVTWTNTAANLKDGAQRLTKLRWIQSLAAGPNDVLSAGFDASKIAVTTGSGLHDHTVAEHTLGLLLPDRPAGKFTTLRDANVVVWGFGNIAKRLTPLLVALGAHVKGVARSAGVRDGIEVVGEDQLPAVLPTTDALVMILPGSDATRNALSAERIKLLPAHAWVVNVGRGTSVDEAALAKALNEGRLGGAALDVFETEPLPAASELWKAKNLVVSPHAAGGRPQGAEALIADNLRRFRAGQPLKNVI
ncbi:hypothetical protein SPBR_00881 [Sporothrix brasiliensis 5110]|uniref:D-isomer specific 2-hydroxyacid dehydrogenase NAD-binding domain-containing protein n=1 Tax=Sporothrix brasiliensis 5110 TaxID=1398154 RepID=A0A0C2J0Y3_9PEZI|nr:uncharacterized protein SPBR_00881 [Sporothrix brasiliensis 5110]KIH90812.1 hypothetical protein SPBR_00881 [Sporothrix brasiliensis 5110]